MNSKRKTGFSLTAKTCERLHTLSFVLGMAQSQIVEDGVEDVVAKLTPRQREAFHAACAARANPSEPPPHAA